MNGESPAITPIGTGRNGRRILMTLPELSSYAAGQLEFLSAHSPAFARYSELLKQPINELARAPSNGMVESGRRHRFSNDFDCSNLPSLERYRR